jgi:MFS family permease
MTALQQWGRRRWLSAGVATLATVLVVGLPSDLVPNPVFGRQIDAPWWAWPVLLATSVLSGLLVATYVRAPQVGTTAQDPLADRPGRRGLAGGVLTFFAVGCPVCNKIVLLALGYAGALRWFEPVQPLLAVGAVLLLGWALRARLRGEVACPVRTDGPGATA